MPIQYYIIKLQNQLKDVRDITLRYLKNDILQLKIINCRVRFDD